MSACLPSWNPTSSEERAEKYKKLKNKWKKKIRKALQEVSFECSPEYREATADLWKVMTARWIVDHIDRKLVKRPVMTYPYAVTLYGIQEQLIEELSDRHGAGKISFPAAHIEKMASMLRGVVFEAIKETVVAAGGA